MGVITFFTSLFKSRKPILTDENKHELQELHRAAYMEQARMLVEERAKMEAKRDLGIKPKKEIF